MYIVDLINEIGYEDVILKDISEQHLKNGVYIKVTDLNKSLLEQEIVCINKKEDCENIENRELIDWFKKRYNYSKSLNGKSVSTDSSIKSVILGSNFNVFSFNSKKPLEKVDGGSNGKKYFKTYEDSFDVLISDYFIKLLKDGTIYNKFDEVIKPLKFKGLNNKETKVKKSEIKDFYFKQDLELFENQERADKINKHKDYLLNNIENLINLAKDNLKTAINIYFENDVEEYIKEHSLYLKPNVFTKNKFNEYMNDELCGISSLMLISDGKPLLPTTSRKTKVLSLVSIQDAIKILNFKNWLKIRKNENSEIDIKNIKISLSKDNEIQSINRKVYNNHTKVKTFIIKNILQTQDKDGYMVDDKSIKLEYGNTRLAYWIDKNFYSGCLYDKITYFNFSGKVPTNKKKAYELFCEKNNVRLRNILKQHGEHIYLYLRDGKSNVFSDNLFNIMHSMFVEQYKKKDEKIYKLQNKFNIFVSIVKHLKKEGDVILMNNQKLLDLQKIMLEKFESDSLLCDTDEEFYYYIGQLGYYLSTLSKANDKKVSILDSIIHHNSVDMIKNKLMQNKNKYNHELALYGERFNKIYSMVLTYQPKRIILNTNSKMLVEIGALSKNLIYKTK